MKKIVILILCCFILTACKNETPKVSLADYQQFVTAINEQSDFVETSQYYTISLVMNKLEDGYRYDLLLGNVTEKLESVRIVCLDDTGADYFPSLGVYDEPVILDNYIDKQNNIYKGINLSGVTQKSQVEVKVLVEFKDNNHQIHQEYIKLSKGMEE